MFVGRERVARGGPAGFSSGALAGSAHVDHLCPEVLVTQQFLQGADVCAVFQEVRCEGMTEGLGAGRLIDVSSPHSRRASERYRPAP